jgi:hypothetical protein
MLPPRPGPAPGPPPSPVRGRCTNLARVDLATLTRRAIDHAIESIADSGTALIPFMMMLDESNPATTSCG